MMVTSGSFLAEEKEWYHAREMCDLMVFWMSFMVEKVKERGCR
jgi:hypothetical protein